MNKKFILYLLLFNTAFVQAQHLVQLDFGDWDLKINKKGQIAQLKSTQNGRNYMTKSVPSPLVSVRVGGERLLPKSAKFVAADSTVLLYFPKGVAVAVQVRKKAHYATFEVLRVTPEHMVEALIWGPYETILDLSVGETVGIVQGVDYTMGLQALNPKTLGGLPWNDNDHLPQLDIFSQPDFDSLSNPKRFVLYSLEAAKPTRHGSSLQAYTRNRDKDRVIKNWGMDAYTAPAFDDGGLVGSKIALFACPNRQTLDRIGEIELGEGLPHPTINGVWVKKSPIINSSYLIMDFTEGNIDTCLEYSQKIGFGYLYHGHPFETWGHFPLIKAQFPNGYAGMRACAEKASKKGIYLGTHMLSNFITTNDPYVTPVPDPRLATVGSSTLTEAVTATTQTIVLADHPEFFQTASNNNLKSVRIGNEIIRYESIAPMPPFFVLKNCQRGQFGTTATAHNKGETISKLTDHGYNVFLGNASLNKEMAENMADFMNATQVRMLDFDGLEGNHSTGMGNYGEALFADAWFRRLNEDIRNHYLLGASRSGHFFWHHYSRMNWGEPWYAGFRESQTEYRLRNQAYFKRNLMPGMLGWFKFTPSTTVEDINWLMARSAAYNAGFAFVSDLASFRANGYTEEILRNIRVWEQARLRGIFTPELQQRMLPLDREFTLRQKTPDTYALTEVFSHKYAHPYKVRQPGEPLHSTFEVHNAHIEQPLQWIITAVQSDISQLVLTLANYKTYSLPVTLRKGETIKYTGGTEAVVYDPNWQVVARIPMQPQDWNVGAGTVNVQFNCKFDQPSQEATAKVELIVIGAEEVVD